MAFGNGPKVVSNGLILSLDAADRNSYSGTGTVWNDLSGNGNNGTLTNGPTYSSENGGTIVFDGTNDTIALTATTVTLGMVGGNFTVNVWLNNNGTTKGGIVSAASSATLGNTYELTINSANNVQVTYYGGGSVNTSIVSNTWYMITHTYVYATRSSKLYKNGLLTSSTTMTTDLTTTGPLIIGWYGYGGGYLNGKIPITQIYNKELSATEVLQNYNALKSRFNLT